MICEGLRTALRRLLKMAGVSTGRTLFDALLSGPSSVTVFLPTTGLH